MKIKILVISANFPPDHVGGYGLRIKEIVDGLAQLGHEIIILTSRLSGKNICGEQNNAYSVLRKLHNRYNARFFPKEVLYDLVDTQFIDRKIKTFQPDVIYLGHIYILSKALLPYLANKDIPLILDEGGASLKGAWTERGRWFRFTGDYVSRYKILNKIRPFVIKMICRLSDNKIKSTWSWPDNLRVIFNNERNRNNALDLGIPVQNAKVIHSGIDIERFPLASRKMMSSPIKLIYPARIEPLKGQLDAIRLVNHLQEIGIDTKLIVVGPIFSHDYYLELVNEINTFDLSNWITFIPMVTQEELGGLYHESDIFFFPSYHKMGFSRTPLEAMACGCVVLTYGNEGSDEIITDGVNGFFVQPCDYQQIVSLVSDLISNPVKVRSVIKYAREEVENKYSLKPYVGHIEAYLLGSFT